MGTRENAFLQYLSGNNADFTEDNVSPEDLTQFQRMAAIAVAQGGKLNYADYPKNENNEQFRHTVGRTGPGDISQVGNTYVIHDRYDFNSKNQSPLDRIQGIAKGLISGHPVDALGHAAAFGGTEFDTNIRVPVPLDQQATQPAYDPNNTVVGGQQYKWVPQQISPEQSYQDIAKQAFASNKYMPEGSNLANYANMIAKQNRGNTSNIVYTPVAVNQTASSQNDSNPVASTFGSIVNGISSLFG